MAKNEDGRGKPPIRDLRDLGAALGYTPPPDTEPSSSGQSDYYRKPPLVRLYNWRRWNGDESQEGRRERKANAVASILAMNRDARARAGVRVVVLGDLSTEGRLVKQDEDTVTAKIAVIHKKKDGSPTVTDISDDLLHQFENVTLEDLMRRADEVRPETDKDRQIRLIFNIMGLGRKIGEQEAYLESHGRVSRTGTVRRGEGEFSSGAGFAKKITTEETNQELDRLNGIKTLRIYDFLMTSLRLEGRSQLQLPLFVWNPQGADTVHGDLFMWETEEPDQVTRLRDSSLEPQLTDGTKMYPTSINTEVLEDNYNNFLRLGDDVPEYVRVGAATYVLLQLPEILQRQRARR